MTARRNRRSLGTVLLNAPYLLWAALFILIPLVIVLYYACTDGDGQFTLSNFAYLKDYGSVMLRSFWYSLAATAICLLIAYPYAYIVCRFRPAGQRFANLFIMLPMWINLLIRTYCLMTLMEGNGLINQLLAFLGFGKLPLLNNTGAVIFGMVYNYLPYMILPIYNVMSRIDPALVVSGVIMVFVPSVSTFYISKAMGGSNNFMIGDLIESQIHSQNSNLPVAAALSTVLMVVILVSMFILNRFSSDSEGGSLLV